MCLIRRLNPPFVWEVRIQVQIANYVINCCFARPLQMFGIVPASAVATGAAATAGAVGVELAKKVVEQPHTPVSVPVVKAL